jgi:hypothetical protein
LPFYRNSVTSIPEHNLKFNAYCSVTNTGKLEVGYITNPADFFFHIDTTVEYCEYNLYPYYRKQ